MKKLLLLFLLFQSLFASKEFIPSARVQETYERIYGLMKEEFGGLPVSTEASEVHDIPTRDGITLRTRVWIPIDYVPGEKRSAILDRTPYGPAFTAISMIWALDGYVIVMQDQRGTYGSTGEFEIWRKDGEDAYDTSEWISRQSWSNGKVMSFGISADGVSVYTQPMLNNPWLAAQFPIFGVGNGHELCYPGGVYLQNLIEGWLDGVCNECIEDVKLNEIDGPFWDSVNLTDHFANVHFPSVHWAGWYDIFLQGGIKAYEGYKKQGQPEIRNSTWLFIEPHGHCYDVVYLRGISLLGLRLGRMVYKLADTGVRDPLLDSVRAINLYVMGSIDGGLLGPGHYFTSLDDWPEFTPTTYYLSGDRTLSTSIPANSSISYTYDPANSAPTIGGNNLFGSCGPLDQTPNEGRSDYVVFTSAPLLRQTAITGQIRAVLFVSSSGNDTDFLVKVTDVYPDGQSILVQEGSFRMRWRGNKRTDPVPIVPNQVYEIEIEIWNSALIFARQHSIRVSVTSSNQPRYQPNPNNGNLIVDGGGNVIVRNTIHVGPSYPSRVILPFVSDDQIPPAAYNNW